MTAAMTTMTNRVAERLTAGLKKFQPILTTSKARDDGEADTVMIVTDMLADLFGYDKYAEVTAEYAIRGTYCDLATKLDGTAQALVEVKAIGLELKDQHVKQAVDYAANQGVDWVVLTNGTHWRIYNVIFGKPIDQNLVVDIDVCALSPKNRSDLEILYLFCKEGWIKSVLGDYQLQRHALSRFFLGALVLSDPILEVLRRDLGAFLPTLRLRLSKYAMFVGIVVLVTHVDRMLYGFTRVK